MIYLHLRLDTGIHIRQFWSKITSFFVFLLFSFSLLSQDVHIQRKSLEVRIKLVDEKPEIIATELMQKVINSVEMSGAYDLKEMVYFDEFEEVEKVEAFTMAPSKKGKMIRHDVGAMVTEDVLSEGIFYSGNKRHVISYANVVDGSILYCKSVKKYKEPTLLPMFFFDDHYACDTSELIVVVDKGVDVNFLHYHYDKAKNIKYSTRQKKNGAIEHKWKAVDMSPRSYEDDAPGGLCRYPHSMFHITTYQSNGETISVLRDESDLFKWYTGMVKFSDAEIEPEYQQVLDQLKKKTDDPVELAEGIYNWVQHNINYIAFEDGFAGFIPRSPQSVMKNRYGDCKDMAMLTHTMMKQCGIDSYLTWIGTRNRCYSYGSCPTPMVDNHMIVSYPVGDEIRFLDPTNTFLEFGTPSSFTQGKESMVWMEDDVFSIVPVPTIPAERNVIYDSLYFNLEGKAVVGHGINRLSGYEKVDFEYGLAYSSLSPEQLFLVYNSLGNESSLIYNLVQKNTNSNQGVLSSEYDFKVDPYVQQFGNSLFVNPFIRGVIDIKIADRQLNLEIPHKYKREVFVEIEIPEGFTLVNIPDDVNLSGNDLKLSVEYELSEGKVSVHYTFVCDTLEIDSADFESVAKILRGMKKILRQQIEFTHEN